MELSIVFIFEIIIILTFTRNHKSTLGFQSMNFLEIFGIALSCFVHTWFIQSRLCAFTCKTLLIHKHKLCTYFNKSILPVMYNFRCVIFWHLNYYECWRTYRCARFGGCPIVILITSARLILMWLLGIGTCVYPQSHQYQCSVYSYIYLSNAVSSVGQYIGIDTGLQVEYIPEVICLANISISQITLFVSSCEF